MKHTEFLTGDVARDRRNVDLLLGAVEQMNGGQTEEVILTRAVDSAIELTGGERGVLLLADAKGGMSVRVARDRHGGSLPLDVPISGTTIRRVMTTGQPTLEAPDLTMSMKAQGLRSVLAVPLRRDGRPVGVIYVDSHATTRGFSAGDRAVFETLAALAANAIERHEDERRRRDLASAREIQLRMAPRDIAPPPGFDIAFEGRSADETSGDYHDVIPLHDGTIALVVGDVSGHGIAAALYMTAVRASLRTILHVRGDPLAAMRELNTYLCAELHGGSFVSLLLGIVDPRTRTLTWVSAGHQSIVAGTNGRTTALASTGPALGIVPGASYGVAGPLALAPGDAVVLYTDGLHEAQNPEGEMYGEEERLIPSIQARAARDPGARALLDGVLLDLRLHVGGATIVDDVTCVVLRVLA